MLSGIKYGKDYLKEGYTVNKPEDLVTLIIQHANYLTEALGLSGKVVAVNPRVLAKLIEVWKKHGVPYCPCRFERNEDTICPCIYHVQELLKYGRCKCGLFKIVDV